MATARSPASAGSVRHVRVDHSAPEQSTGPRPADYRRLTAHSLIAADRSRPGTRLAPMLPTSQGGSTRKSGDHLLEATRWEYRTLPCPTVGQRQPASAKMVQRTNPMIIAGWTLMPERRVVRAGFSQRQRQRQPGSSTARTYQGELPHHTAAILCFTKSILALRLFIPGTDKAHVISNKTGSNKVYVGDEHHYLTLSAPTFALLGFDVIVTDYDDRKRSVIRSSTARWTPPTHRPAEIKVPWTNCSVWVKPGWSTATRPRR